MSSEQTDRSFGKARHLPKAVWLVVIGAFGIASLLLGAIALISASEGADFASVFSEPAQTIDGEAEVAWIEGEPLLRDLEPQTREAVEFAWVRSLAAVTNASANGDLSGVDVWFSGPAKEQLNELLSTGAVAGAGNWLAHEVTPDFYSIDGQILMTHIERSDQDSSETVRVVFILRDGNWRVEHLTRIS